jgi:hypothetical protein
MFTIRKAARDLNATPGPFYGGGPLLPSRPQHADEDVHDGKAGDVWRSPRLPARISGGEIWRRLDPMVFTAPGETPHYTVSCSFV